MKFFRDLADQNIEGSVSDKARRNRMKIFQDFCLGLGKGLKIIDIGGTYYHWQRTGEFLKEYELTLLNIEGDSENRIDNVRHISADARELDFIRDKEFDIAYSNSVIEHFGEYEEQMKVAENIRRIAHHYFVQTPNYYFPVEPHFLFPYFQMLPEVSKKWLVMNFSLGWFDKQSDVLSAEKLVKSVRLLKRNELESLFPEAEIIEEKFLLMNKSFIAYY